MCDLCKQLLDNPKVSLKVAENFGSWVEFLGSGHEIAGPCFRTSYFNAEYLNHIEVPLNFCPYCGSKIAQVAIRRPTGMEDCNGHPLFEGDVVETKYGRLCKIVWFESPSRCGWDLEPYAKLHKKAPDHFDLWAAENLMFVEV